VTSWLGGGAERPWSRPRSHTLATTTTAADGYLLSSPGPDVRASQYKSSSNKVAAGLRLHRPGPGATTPRTPTRRGRPEPGRHRWPRAMEQPASTPACTQAWRRAWISKNSSMAAMRSIPRAAARGLQPRVSGKPHSAMALPPTIPLLGQAQVTRLTIRSMRFSAPTAGNPELVSGTRTVAADSMR